MPSKQELEATEKMIFGESIRKSRVSKKDTYTLDEFNVEVIRQARDKFRGTQFEDTFEHFAGKWENDESIRRRFETFNEYLKDELAQLRKSREAFAKSKTHKNLVAKHKSRISKAGLYYEDMGGVPHWARREQVEEKVAHELENGEFDEILDEMYGDVTIAGYTYSTSLALKRVDLPLYQYMMSDEVEYIVDEIFDDPSRGAQYGYLYTDEDVAFD